MTTMTKASSTKLNPVTLKRLIDTRAYYLKQLKQTRERLSVDAFESAYIDLEIEHMAEGINYLEGLKDEIARRGSN